MENKGLLGALAGIVAVVIVAIVSISKLPSAINVSTAPSNVSVTGAPSEDSGLIGANAGEISNFTSLQTSDDLIVGDQISVAGTSTFSGNVAGNVPQRSVITMTSATTTPCYVQNTSGSDRILADVSGYWTATAGAGTVGIQVGTSTNQYTAGTPKLISNAVFANNASISSVLTTSTVQTAYAIWKANEYLVWNTVTTTNAGTCSAISF